MPQPVTMPKFGQMVEESTISRWVKQEGEQVRAGDLLFEVETDKATMEVESFFDGVLLKIVVPEGQTVPVLSTVAWIGAAGEALPVAEAPKASPRAARLARESQVDLAKVKGSGPGGRIVEDDIRSYLAASPPVAAETLSPTRQVIAARVSQSFSGIPHFYVTRTVDMTDAETLRSQLRQQQLRITVTDLVVHATARALLEFPLLNSSTDGKSVRRNEHVNIGLVVALESGLVAPVLRDADRLTLAQIHNLSDELAAKATAGKITPDEMTGATFTVSNLGMFDVENFSAIIYPGQSAILAVSTIHATPAVYEGEIVIRSLMRMTLSADHRLIDGTLAARFLNAIRARLESPKGALAEAQASSR